MNTQIVPGDVIRILSFHGPVAFKVGDDVSTLAQSKVETAPFEDRVEAFVPRDGPIARALMGCCRAEITANKEDGEYSLRMIGRAHAGILAARHPDRGALEPWVPEGRKLRDYVVVPFVPERLELVRNEAGDRVRYYGQTPAGRTRPKTLNSWAIAAFGGRALWLAFIAGGAPFFWLVYMGADYPGRGLAMFTSLLAGLSLVAGTHLLTVQMAFRCWREGKAEEAEASVLARGLLAPALVARVGVYLVLVGIIAGLLLLVNWGLHTFLVGAMANGAWLAGPASWLHLAARKTERK